MSDLSLSLPTHLPFVMFSFPARLREGSDGAASGALVSCFPMYEDPVLQKVTILIVRPNAAHCVGDG